MFKCSGFKLDGSQLATSPAQEKMHSDGVEVGGTLRYFFAKGKCKLYLELLLFHHCSVEDSQEVYYLTNKPNCFSDTITTATFN